MLSRLFNLFSSSSRTPTVAERMAARTSEFQCISLMPYVTPAGDLDYNRPFQYPAMIRPVADVGPIDRAVWTTAKISCADDICMEAARAAYNTEMKAAGLELTTRAALLEAARAPEAEICRYIVLQHPIQQRKYGCSSIVLENTSEKAAASDKALVISMVERWSY